MTWIGVAVMFTLSAACLALFYRAAPLRNDLADPEDEAPPRRLDPWRRPIDTRLSVVLTIARGED